MDKLSIFVFLSLLLAPAVSALRLDNASTLFEPESKAATANSSEDQKSSSDTKAQAPAPTSGKTESAEKETSGSAEKTASSEADKSKAQSNLVYNLIGAGAKVEASSKEWPVGGSVKVTSIGKGFLSCSVTSDDVDVAVQHQPTNGIITLNGKSSKITPNSDGSTILIIHRGKTSFDVYLDTLDAKGENFKRNAFEIDLKQTAVKDKKELISLACTSQSSAPIMYYSTFNEANVFGPWSDWSACSTTCGEGLVTRTRASLIGAKLESDKKLKETKPCKNEKVCLPAEPANCYKEHTTIPTSGVTHKIYSLSDCQKKCAATKDCFRFVFDLNKLKCLLVKAEDYKPEIATTGFIVGPPKCSDSASEVIAAPLVAQKKSYTFRCPEGKQLNMLQCTWGVPTMIRNFMSKGFFDRTFVCKKYCNGKKSCEATPHWSTYGTWGLGDPIVWIPDKLFPFYQCIPAAVKA